MDLKDTSQQQSSFPHSKKPHTCLPQLLAKNLIHIKTNAIIAYLCPNAITREREFDANLGSLGMAGNIRRVRVIQNGRVILEIPLSVGAPAAAIGILVAPVLAALGAFAALVTECTIEVEKFDPGEKKA